MKNRPPAVRNKPPYALGSVDNALRLLHLLRDEGRLRVSDAAESLGVARSTAHRLLSMLVFRDFAVQDDDHTYLPGPAFSATPRDGRPLRVLRRTLLPLMERLSEQTGETVNLMIRVGTESRFLATVEARRTLHISDRQGTVLPAHLATGGKLLLAELDDDTVRALYEQRTDVDLGHLLAELAAVRRKGYSLNLDATEVGVSAIGATVRDAGGEAVAALAIAMPSVRFDHANVPTWHKALTETTALAAQLLD